MTFPSLFIFCDADEHAGRRVAVTNFRNTPGGWNEVPASRAPDGTTGAGTLGTGRQIVSDQPADVGWALDPSVGMGESRVRFELQCRRCRSRVVANAETLYAILGGFHGAGFDEVALSVLGASMGRQHGR